jgi:type III secretion system YscQ/HrcQ family protein
VFDGQLRIGQNFYRFSISILNRNPFPPRTRFDLTKLRSMGNIQLQLPLVAARFTVPSTLINSLQIGDALLPDSGWLIHRVPSGFRGQPLLQAPDCNLALCTELHDNQQLVLGEKLMNLSADEPLAPAPDAPDQATVADAIASAPLVVQIEIASVSLAASHWAELKPGDVISTGHPLGDQVLVRVAGREIALGELVDIDGELGVRIKSFISSERVSQ